MNAFHENQGEPSPMPPGAPSDLARRNTVADLCAAWSKSQREVVAAFKLIERAQERMTQVFKGGAESFNIQSYQHAVLDFNRPESALKRLERQAWASIVKQLALRPLMAMKRLKELDAQLASGEGLPAITYDNVMSTVAGLLENRMDMLKEKVIEVYEWLRPANWSKIPQHKWSTPGYKTNQKSYDAGVGEKVIIGCGCERNYSTGYRINYNRKDNIRALEQVFHLLDGKPQPESYYGEIADAVAQQTKSGGDTAETEYFAVRCCKNGNLHLRFKRLDLLAEFNLIAGGKKLN